MGGKFYTYILLSKKDKWLYIGHTNNIENRLKSHNDGQVLSTKRRKPFIVVKVEEYETRSDAFKREQYLKSGQGREWLQGYLNERPPAAGLRTCKPPTYRRGLTSSKGEWRNGLRYSMSIAN